MLRWGVCACVCATWKRNATTPCRLTSQGLKAGTRQVLGERIDCHVLSFLLVCAAIFRQCFPQLPSHFPTLSTRRKRTRAPRQLVALPSFPQWSVCFPHGADSRGEGCEERRLGARTALPFPIRNCEGNSHRERVDGSVW